MGWTRRSARYYLVDTCSGPNGMEDICLDGDWVRGLGPSANLGPWRLNGDSCSSQEQAGCECTGHVTAESSLRWPHPSSHPSVGDPPISMLIDKGFFHLNPRSLLGGAKAGSSPTFSPSRNGAGKKHLTCSYHSQREKKDKRSSQRWFLLLVQQSRGWWIWSPLQAL